MRLDGVVRDGDPISEDEAAGLFGALYTAYSTEAALVLAVSGGPDSVALMWLMARWRDGLERKPRLIAVTVDHGLRKESPREALAVKKLAKALKIEHRTLRWTGRKPQTGIPEAARHARYRLLSKAVRQGGGRTLLTAHTLDDQAETILFRMARGSGVSGLTGMGWLAFVPVPEGRGIQLIRPLLKVSKARLIATLNEAKVAYALDPSNADPRFMRPRLRALMPLLAREGLTAERLSKLAERAQRLEDLLFDAVNQAQSALCPDGLSRNGPTSIDSGEFFDLHPEIGLRLLRRMVDWHGDEGPAGLGKVEGLYEALARRGAGAPVRRTLAGALVTLAGARFSVGRAPPRRTGAKPRLRGVETPFTTPT
jgi:tRNA(Ile)-lysidine synthase